MFGLENIAFSSPWILAALITLPVLWWLLKITPPAAKKVQFGAIRFLKDIQEDKKQSKSTPPWLLLLRLLILACIILAFATPYIANNQHLNGRSDIVIIIDNDWASNQVFEQQQSTALSIIQESAGLDIPIYLITTAKNHQTKRIDPISATTAMETIRSISAKPWMANYQSTDDQVFDLFDEKPIQSFYLDNGLTTHDENALLNRLKEYGSLEIFTPTLKEGFFTLSRDNQTGSDLSFTVQRHHSNNKDQTIHVQLLGSQNSVLKTQSLSFTNGNKEQSIVFDLPVDIRNQLTAISIEGQNHLGAKHYLNPSDKRHKVGLLSIAEQEGSAYTNYMDNNLYLDKALSPYHELSLNDWTHLKEQKISTLIINDNRLLTDHNIHDIKNWVSSGGVLIRFADQSLANQDDQTLLPVPIRSLGRDLEAVLSWDTPQTIGMINASSPFGHLSIPNDIQIEKQILAEPSIDLNQYTWVQLSDGTPLVTAKKQDKGWVILFHVSAVPDWSNLPLSGLFVDMLNQLVRLSPSFSINDNHRTDNQSIWRLDKKLRADGFFVAPDGYEQTITNLSTYHPQSKTPVGLYKIQSGEVMINLSDYIDDLSPFGQTPIDTHKQDYNNDQNLYFKPLLLSIAFILFLIEFISLLWIGRSKGLAAAILFLALIFSTPQVNAQERSPADLASGVQLAYVKTGDQTIDNLSHAGMIGLKDQVIKRTSADIVGVVGINIEQDDLFYYPFIYWAVTDAQAPISEQAAQKIQSYFAHGGTILFDTRDQFNVGNNRSGSFALRALTQNLSIPSLETIPTNHVLTRSFYLLSDFPGRYSGGDLWIAPMKETTNDGVSPLIVGGNDWVGAWAVDQNGFPVLPLKPGGERQREMAYRFGVNLVLYALTGNYKNDQVHIPFILERLGQ